MALKKDDPYLKQCSKHLDEFIGIVTEKLDSKYFNNDPNIEHSMKELLKFSSLYIRHFPKSAESALTLCGYLYVLVGKKALVLTNKEYSQILGVCLSIIVFNRTEKLIRDSCILLIRLLKQLDGQILSFVLQKYSRNFPMVLRKVANVKTYLTQCLIMEVLFRVTENMKDKRLGFLKDQSFFSRIPANDVNEVMKLFLQTDVENAYNSSRNFLVHLNHELANKNISIFTVGDGAVTAVNEKFMTPEGQLMLDFNAAQKCVSFVAPMENIFKFLPKWNDKPAVTNKLVYFELSYEKVEAKRRNSDEIFVTLTLSDAMYSEEFKQPLRKIKNLSMVVFQIIEKNEQVLKAFIEVFYENILADAFNKANVTLACNESIISCQTDISCMPKFTITGKENAEILNTEKSAESPSNDLEQSQNLAHGSMEVEETPPLNKEDDLQHEKTDVKPVSSKPKTKVVAQDPFDMLLFGRSKANVREKKKINSKNEGKVESKEGQRNVTLRKRKNQASEGVKCSEKAQDQINITDMREKKKIDRETVKEPSKSPSYVTLRKPKTPIPAQDPFDMLLFGRCDANISEKKEKDKEKVKPIKLKAVSNGYDLTKTMAQALDSNEWNDDHLEVLDLPSNKIDLRDEKKISHAKIKKEKVELTKLKAVSANVNLNKAKPQALESTKSPKKDPIAKDVASRKPHFQAKKDVMIKKERVELTKLKAASSKQPQALESVKLSEKAQDLIEMIDSASSNNETKKRKKKITPAIVKKEKVKPTRKTTRKSKTSEQKNASIYDMESDEENLPLPTYKVFSNKIRQKRKMFSDDHDEGVPEDKRKSLRLTKLFYYAESDGDDEIYEQCARKIEMKKETVSRKRSFPQTETNKKNAKPKQPTLNLDRTFDVVDDYLASVNDILVNDEENERKQPSKKIKISPAIANCNEEEVLLDANTTVKLSDLDTAQIYRYLMQGTHELGLIPIE